MEGTNVIYSPVKGKMLNIEDVKDPMFSNKILGDGVAFATNEDLIYAPVTGRIESILPTKHAIGICSDDGVEILIHIGIDTFGLKGKGFKSFVKQGDYINKGDKLISVNHKSIRRKGYDDTIMMIITNFKNYENVDKLIVENVSVGEEVLKVY